jgi:LuxR family transcriptional regulator, maltose regulon positive regulatory protein
MSPHRASAWVERPRLTRVLSSDAAVVALVGARGAGKSALLRAWGRQVAAVEYRRGEAPSADALLVDDADALTPEDWRELAGLLELRPGLRIRVAARSLHAVPDDWDAVLVRDLPFTLPEVREYLALRDSSADAAALLIATMGLPALVRRLVQTGAAGDAAMERSLAAIGRSRALAAAASAAAEPAVLTRELAAQLGADDALLARAEAEGDGWWLPDAEREMFAFSPAVRAATRAAHPLDAPVRRGLREQAAQQLCDERAWIGAILEAAAVARWDIAEAALTGGGMGLLAPYGPLIAAAFAHVPAHRLRKHPVVAMALAIIYNARRHTRMRAIELFGVALVGMQTAPRGSSERALLRSLEAVVRRLLALGDGGAKSALSALATLTELPPAERERLDGLRGDLLLHNGLSLLYAGRLHDARDALEQAAASARRPASELAARGGVAAVHALEGDMPAAQRWIDAAGERTWAPALIDEYPGSLLRIAQAIAALERGEPDTAASLLERIWPIIDTIEHWPLLAYVRGLADIASGHAAEGLERLRALRRLRGGRVLRPSLRLLDAIESQLALAAGDLVAARALQVHRADAPGVRLAAARVMIADGDDERALRLVVDTPVDSPSARTTAAALTAVILARRGGAEAAASIAHALALRRTYGLHTPFLLLPADAPPALGIAGVAAAPAAAAPRLTPREAVVLGELVRSDRLQDVADRLHVSANTVRSQRRSLYRKLGAANREEALAAAAAHGLLGSRSLTPATIGTDASTPTSATPNSSA